MTASQQAGLANPIRVAVLTALAQGPVAPVDVARATGMPLGSVAYHVRTLERLGLIELAGETRVRGAVKHTYRLADRDAIASYAGALAAALAALQNTLTQEALTAA